MRVASILLEARLVWMGRGERCETGEGRGGTGRGRGGGRGRRMGRDPVRHSKPGGGKGGGAWVGIRYDPFEADLIELDARRKSSPPVEGSDDDVIQVRLLIRVRKVRRGGPGRVWKLAYALRPVGEPVDTAVELLPKRPRRRINEGSHQGVFREAIRPMREVIREAIRLMREVIRD